MSRSILLCDQSTEIRIIWVFIPPIVVTKLLPRVVRRIGHDQIDLAPILIKSHHRLKIFTLDKEVSALIARRTYVETRLAAHHTRPDFTRNFLCRSLAMECQSNAAAKQRLRQTD